jgi:hypothetical protein
LFLETGSPKHSVMPAPTQNKIAPTSLIRALTYEERFYQLSNLVLPYIPFILSATDIFTW